MNYWYFLGITIWLLVITYYLQRICYKLQFFQDVLIMYWENRAKELKESKANAKNNV